MTLFELAGTAISSIFAGGATGLLGAALQRLFDWLKVKQDLQLFQAKASHELAMRQQDALLMEKEWTGRLRVAEAETAGKVGVADAQAFEASLLREPERYSYAPTLTPWQQWVMVLLDFARGIIRPFLTAYLCVFVTYIWFQVRALLSMEDLDADSVIQIWKTVVATILYVWTTVTLWWFGTRSKTAPPSSKLL